MGKPLELDDTAIARILEAVAGIEYGNVQIVVHDGRIVQIDRTERRRFDAAEAVKTNASAAKSHP